jgi:hypothetical protein
MFKSEKRVLRIKPKQPETAGSSTKKIRPFPFHLRNQPTTLSMKLRENPPRAANPR